MIGHLLVVVGSKQFGLPLEGVEEVVAVEGLLPAPGAREAVRGVIPVRGRLLPLVHLGALLSEVTPPDALADAAVVVTVDGARVAFEVDAATDLVRDQPEPVPSRWQIPWATGVVRRDEALIPIVDLAALDERLRPAGAGEPT